MSQQQGACLGPVARRQQLGSGSLHVPAALLLVCQQVGAERGVQGRRDAADEEPSVEQRGEELCVAGLRRLLQNERRKGFSVQTTVVFSSTLQEQLLRSEHPPAKTGVVCGQQSSSCWASWIQESRILPGSPGCVIILLHTQGSLTKSERPDLPLTPRSNHTRLQNTHTQVCLYGATAAS